MPGVSTSRGLIIRNTPQKTTYYGLAFILLALEAASYFLAFPTYVNRVTLTGVNLRRSGVILGRGGAKTVGNHRTGKRAKQKVASEMSLSSLANPHEWLLLVQSRFSFN
jgi:hypothetical protein